MNSESRTNSLTDGFKPLQRWLKNSGTKALVFYHVPKCAGTSFRACLTRNFNTCLEIQTFHDWIDLQASVKNPSFDNEQDVALFGHSTWGIHEILTDRDVYYITFLRDPVDRMLSRYREERSRRFEEIPIREFLIPRIQHGGMVTYLGNGSLELAAYRLMHCFDSFGIVEQYQKSLRWFQSIYDFKTIDSPHLNKTRERGNETELRCMIRELFMELNPDELRFYEHAVHEFNARNPVRQVSPNPEVAEPGKKAVTAKQKSAAVFDPFKEIKKQVEQHVAREEYDDAIRLLENCDDMSFFGPDRLTDLYARKGDMKNAARWAREKERGFIHDYLRFYKLTIASHPDEPSLKVIMLLNKLAEFSRIHSLCPDSSLNRDLYTLCANLVIATAHLSFVQEAPTAEKLRTKVSQIIDLKRDKETDLFWDRIQFFANDFIQSNLPAMVNQ